jgi:protein TonB
MRQVENGRPGNRRPAKSAANRIRLLLFLAVAGLHGILIAFLAFNIDAAVITPEQPVTVIRLTDFLEDEPPPPPPPPQIPPPENPDNTVESIAEIMIETEEEPLDQIVVAPGTLTSAPITPVQNYGTGDGEVYLSQGTISVRPVFSEQKIMDNLVYPPIPLRSGIEGMVILELFIDRHGEVQRVQILKEDPEGRGFGEAAAKAFQGLRGTPAEDKNGTAIAVRYRYPVRFTIRG